MIGKIAKAQALQHSSVFWASFAEGKVGTNVIKGQDADTNLISKQFLEILPENPPEIQPTALEPTERFKEVAGEQCVT